MSALPQEYFKVRITRILRDSLRCVLQSRRPAVDQTEGHMPYVFLYVVLLLVTR